MSRRTAAPIREHMRDGPVFKGTVMAWILLLVAGLFEVVWAYSMKLSKVFTNLTYSVITIVMMMASFGLLSVAMRSLPLGTAYTVWTGIGAIGAFIVGIVFLGEQISPMRICAAILIIGGLVLMKLSAH
jgi:quaternary ammonium compound-resistance protein SugE